MKERREVAMLKEPAKNSDVNGSGGLREIKEEVKEEVKGRSSRSTPDAKPSSNKMANGESGTTTRSKELFSVYLFFLFLFHNFLHAKYLKIIVTK